jgi:hypothetical protein
VSKDTIKEALFDTIGASGERESHAFGRAS